MNDPTWILNINNFAHFLLQFRILMIKYVCYLQAARDFPRAHAQVSPTRGVQDRASPHHPTRPDTGSLLRYER